MSNIQAALGLAQLERVDELIESKRRIFSWYADQLGDLTSVSLNFEMEWALSIYWMTSLLLSKDVRVSRDELQAELKKLNIDTRPIFPAISQYNIWPKRQNPNPRALRISHAALNLPTGVCLKRWEVEYICQQIRKIIC